MKRRVGSSRRQVLDLEVRESSPRRTWKNKYQQIVADHSSHNGEAVTANVSTSKEEGRLLNLVGYGSESDGEDEPKQTNTLDAKVNDFLKEIQSLNPTASASTAAVPGSTNMASADAANLAACPWQLCYDESTGYPYYWNTVTNAVTWEPPPEVVAMQAALATESAPSDWAVEEAALGLPPRSSPALVPKPALKPAVSKPPPIETKGKKLNGKRRPPKESDSDDERIEMITSWADDDSDEEEKPSSPQIQKPPEVRKSIVKPPAPKRQMLEAKMSTDVMGPQLPPEHLRPSSGPRPEMGPPPEELDDEAKAQLLQKARRLKGESTTAEEPRDKAPLAGPQPSSRSRSRSSSPGTVEKKWTKSGLEGSEVDDSKMISHLKRQAQLFKELGDIPENKEGEVKSGDESKSDAAPDDIIKLIEMEQPPDHNNTLLPKGSRTDDKSNATETPSSFALIAGYGDDSEPEDNEPTAEASNETAVCVPSTSTHAPAPASSLFPIMQHSAEIQSFVENQKTVPYRTEEKPAEVKESSLPAGNEVKPNYTLTSNPLLESVGGIKRKKRLAVPTRPLGPIQSEEASKRPRSRSKSPDYEERTSKSCVSLGKSDSNESERKDSASDYGMRWMSSYTSDPSSGVHRGFGFQDSASNDHHADQAKGKVMFIKAETINERSSSVDADSGKPRTRLPTHEKEGSKAKSRKNAESREKLSDLASLVSEKIEFLAEGKDSVEAVQIMSIQIETLMSAWQAGALEEAYFSRWLEGMGTQLMELEKKVAPTGWDVHWDRSYKRYFYWNSKTNETQWEYPVESEEKPEPRKASPQKEAPAQPDEDAMEICTTPPPEEIEQEAYSLSAAVQETDLPTQQVVAPTPPSAPPKGRPLQMGPFGPGKPVLQAPEAPESPKEPQPPPPPPPPSSPPRPPPPPDTPPPPPSNPPIPLDTHGEPLPPGVDTPDLPYVVARPSATAATATAAATAAARVAAMHTVGGAAMAAPYAAVGSYTVLPSAEAVMAAYAPVPLQQPLGYVDYREPYMAPVPASVAAPPFAYAAPAPMPIQHPEKTALMSELNSFYSDLAMIETEEDDRSQDVGQTVPKAALPHPSVEPHERPQPENAPNQPEEKVAAPSQQEVRPTASQQASSVSAVPSAASSETPELPVRKKKKPKLGPGLALKKKGVSNLVAKWQQVRQEVWKDYQALDNGDSGSPGNDENDNCDNKDER